MASPRSNSPLPDSAQPATPLSEPVLSVAAPAPSPSAMPKARAHRRHRRAITVAVSGVALLLALTGYAAERARHRRYHPVLKPLNGVDSQIARQPTAPPLSLVIEARAPVAADTPSASAHRLNSNLPLTAAVTARPITSAKILPRLPLQHQRPSASEPAKVAAAESTDAKRRVRVRVIEERAPRVRVIDAEQPSIQIIE
jgi:hypothetical protein